MDDLTSSTATQLAAAMVAGDVSAAEVTRSHLARAQRLDPAIGAFAYLAIERAGERAEAIDAARTRGDALGPLAGVPCPIKDLNPVAGLPFEAGSAALAGTVGEVDDDIAVWLADAGTVCTGKTSTPEFGLVCYTEPEGRRAAVTPWDLSRMAGGSSGGAAAAVAAGFAPIAQGSDGGGSIRIPASCCGLVGLKPSRGRIGHGRLQMPGPGLVSTGVLSRTVADTALAVDVLAGRGVGETYRTPHQQRSFATVAADEPHRLRIGLLTTPAIIEADVHTECRRAAEVTAERLAAAGHDVAMAPVPFPVERWSAFEALWAVGAAGVPIPDDTEHLLRPLTRWLRERGRQISGLEYATAVSAVQRLTTEIADAWDGFDAVLTPTLAQPPLVVGALRDDDDPAGDFAAQTRFTPWTSVANLSGRPAISVPAYTAMIDGVELPIGVMLTGRFGEEATLLQLAAQLEDAVGWRHPGLSL